LGGSVNVINPNFWVIPCEISAYVQSDVKSSAFAQTPVANVKVTIFFAQSHG